MRVLIVLAALIPLAAHATKPTPPPPAPTQQQAQGQSQAQAQGQKQQQGQQQEANLTNVNRNDSSSYSTSGSDNSIVFEAARIPKNTPDVNLGGLFPSSSCMGVGQLGVGVQGFGIGGGKSFVDEECDKRETARSFAALGYSGEALVILCSTKAAQVLEVCPGRPQPAPVCDVTAPSCPDPGKVVDQRKQVAPETSK